MFSLNADNVFYIMGSFDPAASVHISTIDPLNEENNQNCAVTIFEAMQGLGVPNDRYFLFRENLSFFNFCLELLCSSSA